MNISEIDVKSLTNKELIDIVKIMRVELQERRDRLSRNIIKCEETILGQNEYEFSFDEEVENWFQIIFTQISKTIEDLNNINTRQERLIVEITAIKEWSEIRNTYHHLAIDKFFEFIINKKGDKNG
jgi:hypothetical protein